MKFSELCIGDLFNTKSARWVKVEQNHAVVVLSSIAAPGRIDLFSQHADVDLLWSSVLASDRDKALQAEIDRLRALTEWRPIDTAPKDGREVLLIVECRAGLRGMLVGHYMPGGHCVEDHPPIDAGWYFWNGCMFSGSEKPVRWLPLPEPPKGT